LLEVETGQGTPGKYVIFKNRKAANADRHIGSIFLEAETALDISDAPRSFYAMNLSLAMEAAAF
jgi:hypothetical protein